MPRRHCAGRVRHPEGVADDLRVNSWLVIPAGELHERFSRSSGPGGQSVNTADTRVELSYDVTQSAVLPGYARERILDRLGQRMADGVLTVVASEQRSQLQNRRAARGRMANLLREALAPPQRPRIPTRPGRAARERRVADKRRRGAVKRSRRPDSGDPD
jgi:ribosome-associated protein